MALTILTQYPLRPFQASAEPRISTTAFEKGGVALTEPYSLKPYSHAGYKNMQYSHDGYKNLPEGAHATSGSAGQHSGIITLGPAATSTRHAETARNVKIHRQGINYAVPLSDHPNAAYASSGLTVVNNPVGLAFPDNSMPGDINV